MTPEVHQRLADFMYRHKPDTSSGLARFRQEIVALHFMGFSIKASFQYLVEQGASCSLRTFQRWVKENIDFTQETPPGSLQRPVRAGWAEAAKAIAAADKAGESIPPVSNSKASGGIDSTDRKVDLAEARKRIADGFKNPVEEALKSREGEGSHDKQN
jgi:hypothetical protein